LYIYHLFESSKLANTVLNDGMFIQYSERDSSIYITTQLFIHSVQFFLQILYC